MYHYVCVHVCVVTGTYCTDFEDWDLNLLNSPGAVHSVPSCNIQERKIRRVWETGRKERQKKDRGRERERGGKERYIEVERGRGQRGVQKIKKKMIEQA